MSRRPSLTDIEIRTAAHLYQRGVTAKTLAENYRCTRQTIINALRRAGVAIRPKGRARRVVA